MLENYLIRGSLTGLIFGVPAGAIGALTIQRALNNSFLAGLVTGLGSSAADLLYACVGVFGLTLVSDFLVQNQRPVGILGGLLIAALGIHIFRQEPQSQQQESNPAQLPLYFASSFAIAVTNPATVLSFLMAFPAFGITGEQTAVQSVQLIAGIFLGTLFWWLALSCAATVFRGHINRRINRLLNRISGCSMLIFGGAALVKGIFL